MSIIFPTFAVATTTINYKHHDINLGCPRVCCYRKEHKQLRSSWLATRLARQPTTAKSGLTRTGIPPMSIAIVLQLTASTVSSRSSLVVSISQNKGASAPAIITKPYATRSSGKIC